MMVDPVKKEGFGLNRAVVTKLLGALAVVGVLGSAVQTSALSITPTSKGTGPQASASAKLKRSGTEIAVDLPVEVKEEIHANGRDKTRTFTVRVPTALLDDGPKATDSDDKTKLDKSYSMQATLVQNFTEMVVGERTYVKVQDYRGKWVRLDSQVSGRSAELRASCLGPIFNGGTCNNRQVRTVGTPSYDTWYTLTPNWTGQWVLVADTLYHQCGIIDITLVRGSRSWDFWFNVCQGSPNVSF